jgi:hypothetical protein
MSMRAVAAALAALLVSGLAIIPATALSPERSHAVEECMRFQRQHPHSWGGLQHYSYRACMGVHGEPE